MVCVIVPTVLFNKNTLLLSELGKNCGFIFMLVMNEIRTDLVMGSRSLLLCHTLCKDYNVEYFVRTYIRTKLCFFN